MANFTLAEGTSGVDITIDTSTAATAGNFHTSAAINNTTNQWPYILLHVRCRTHATNASSTDKGFHVYLASSADGGTSYAAGVTASQTNASYQTPNLRRVGFVSAPSAATTYNATFLIDFPGPYFIVAIRNRTGETAPASTNQPYDLWYQGLYWTDA